MHDTHGRPITYLRISVTSRCNFRCTYCMPEQGVPERPHADILRYEEIYRIASTAVGMGVDTIRLTGGEPLVRLGFEQFVASLSKLRPAGLRDVAMTTNGSLLSRSAQNLKQAGLDRVNVSLDTLRPSRFALITRRGRLDDTLCGIGAALRAGLHPVKINVVVTSENADEVTGFACLAHELPVAVRFIELMPLGDARLVSSQAVTGQQIRLSLASYGNLVPSKATERARGAGPARYYQWLPGPSFSPAPEVEHALAVIKQAAGDARREASGTIGLITSLTDHFCNSCNRLRLTSDGRLSPCLWSDFEIDLRTPLRSGASDDDLRDLLMSAVAAKPSGYLAVTGAEKRQMHRLGG